MDRGDVDANSSPKDDSCCRLLKLPPELRDRIYDLVFTTDTTSKIDLLTASPPSKSFILTCHQVNVEASAIYKAAYQTFWTTTRFIVDSSAVSDKRDTRNKLRHHRTKDINRITSIQFELPLDWDDKDGYTMRYKYDKEADCWSVHVRSPGRPDGVFFGYVSHVGTDEKPLRAWAGPRNQSHFQGRLEGPVSLSAQFLAFLDRDQDCMSYVAV